MMRYVVLLCFFALLAPETDAQGKRPPNYTRIERGLYLGGWVEEPPDDVTAVLNVTRQKDLYRTKYYLWKPIDDRNGAADIAFLKETVDFIDAQRKAGRPTFVHCTQGISRAPMVMAAYLMYAKKMSRDEAIAYLRERRPIVHPNPSFMELLSVWERTLK